MPTHCLKCNIIAPNNLTHTEEWGLEFPDLEIFLCKNCAREAGQVLTDWLAEAN